jgi:hypothetical protein
MLVRLDEVPLRDASLGPPEILMSESQERMMAVVEPGRVAEFLAVCAKWDVRAAVIGEVTDTGRLVMTWRGETVVDIPPASAADGPVYHRPLARPASQDALAAGDPAALPRPADGAGLRADLLALLGSPGLADKSWSRPVRPVRPRGHRAGHAGRRRAAPGGRGGPASASRLAHRAATVATAGSTRTRAPSWRCPRPTARRGDRGRARLRLPTA